MIFSRKSFFRGVSLAIAALIIISVGFLAGCTAKETGKTIENNAAGVKSETEAPQTADSKVMADFDALLGTDPKAAEVISFIDKNISGQSKKNASAMLLKLEEIQQKQLTDIEKKYYSGEAIQSEMQKIYTKDFNLNKLNETQNQELKALLTETKDAGYKVETAEGMFFPVMDYELYKKYSSYLTDDIKEYIEIMAVESNKTPAKDAALVIGWDDVANRALAQEKFIKNYAGSARLDAVKKLQGKYITFMLFGANNTPLFSYETKLMDAEAKAAYTSAIKDNPDSGLMQMLSEYMNILSKTDYKFSDEADKFRKDIASMNAF